MKFGTHDDIWVVFDPPGGTASLREFCFLSSPGVMGIQLSNHSLKNNTVFFTTQEEAETEALSRLMPRMKAILEDSPFEICEKSKKGLNGDIQ